MSEYLKVGMKVIITMEDVFDPDSEPPIMVGIIKALPDNDMAVIVTQDFGLQRISKKCLEPYVEEDHVERG